MPHEPGWSPIVYGEEDVLVVGHTSGDCILVYERSDVATEIIDWLKAQRIDLDLASKYSFVYFHLEYVQKIEFMLRFSNV